jgi:chromosome segregation ATPase
VKERRQREITEAVLEETTRALDSVRRASIVLAAGAASSKTTNGGGNGSNTNVQPASASSSVKFMTVGRTLKILSNGGKGAEETIEDLLSEIERLRNELETTSLKYDEQDAELAATKQQLRAKEAYIKDRRQNVVELKMDIREVTSDEQIEFIDKTREVLKAAVHSSLQIEQLKKMDRKRTQALAKLVEHMQMQRDALQLKLNDLGFKDTSEDDAIHEAMIAKKFHNANDGGKEEPVKTPSGKTFYVTRMKSSLYERLFGIHI